MFTTGNFTDWTGDMNALGPIYPFVGSEFFMVILGFVFWIGWTIVQMRMESRQLQNEAAELRKSGELQKALEFEKAPQRM